MHARTLGTLAEGLTAARPSCQARFRPLLLNHGAIGRCGRMVLAPHAGKCGMRYHVDPLYGVWAPPSAVVSLGDMRAFVFREITDFSIR